MRTSSVAALLAAFCATAHAEPATFDVTHYDARIEPDLAGKTLRGNVVVSLRIVAPATVIELDAGDLAIDAVRWRNRALAFEKIERRVRIALPRATKAGDAFDLAIDYHGAPSFGLEFHPERDELYTIFSTSQWMVAVDTPGERASLDLRVTLPTGLEAIGNGRLVSRTQADGHRETFHWRQRRAMPSYVYGFAAGRYRTLSERRDGVQLRYLAGTLNEAELKQVFADTGDMLRFFARRAGVRYPERGYAQALVAKTIGQELDGFSLMSEDYGREVLADARAQSLIAHEAAHQWWGNGVTCADWGHFWLNEGFANFMTAAWMEQRWGREEYDRRVERWRVRVDELRAKGADHALVYDTWKPTADDRAVVYQKGAYVLHRLRETLGDAAFWKGIRAWTRRYFGQAVTTADFQKAMERASGRDLSAFFDEWIYARSVVQPVTANGPP